MGHLGYFTGFISFDPFTQLKTRVNTFGVKLLL